MEQDIQLNEHNKTEHSLMHTTDFNSFFNEMIIFKTEDGKIQLDVKIGAETVWLTQAQMCELFQSTKQNISLHINNIFKEKELSKDATVKEYLTVQKEGKRTVKRKIEYYNLDIIISVGYRVKSIQGTRFRIWASRILKDYLIKGFAINEHIKLEHYNELKDIVRIMANTIKSREILTSEQSKGLLAVVTDYVYALDTLDKYDYQQLTIEETTKGDRFHATYQNAMEAIRSLKGKFGESELFANEKDQSFKSSISTIYQTFDGIELYPSIEEKAAMLLYLVTKNHSFSDGNKRIAAMLFLWFMENNGILYHPNGEKRIADNTLVALTLMIAESRTDEKDIMVKVVVNLINQNN